MFKGPSATANGPYFLARNLEQCWLPARPRHAEVLVGKLRGYAATRSAVEKTDLNEEWFVHFFNGFRLFRQGCGQGVKPDRAALVLFNNGQQQPAIDFIKAVLINFQHF